MQISKQFYYSPELFCQSCRLSEIAPRQRRSLKKYTALFWTSFDLERKWKGLSWIDNNEINTLEPLTERLVRKNWRQWIYTFSIHATDIAVIVLVLILEDRWTTDVCRDRVRNSIKKLVFIISTTLSTMNGRRKTTLFYYVLFAIVLFYFHYFFCSLDSEDIATCQLIERTD
jgi:hypothetical protein